MRSGSFRKPRPLLAFDCGSQTNSNVFTSAAEMEEARLMAVVVFPTPPFWLATAMMRPMIILEEKSRAKNSANAVVKSTPYFGATFHVEHFLQSHVSFSIPNVPRGTLFLLSCGASGFHNFQEGMFHVEHLKCWQKTFLKRT